MANQELPDFLNPAKICIGLWLRDYVRGLHHHRISPFVSPDDSLNDSELSIFKLEKITVTPRQSKNVCLLALQLIQECDVLMSDLVKKFRGENSSLTGDAAEMPPFLFKAWKKHLLILMDGGDAHSLLDLAADLEKMISESSSPIIYVHKWSVVGLFIRKMLLGFYKIDFSEVVNLYENLVTYFRQGEQLLNATDHQDESDHDLSSLSVADMSLNMDKSCHHPGVMDNTNDAASASAATSGKENDPPKRDIHGLHPAGDDEDFDGVMSKHSEKYIPWTKRQSEIYISKQVDLLSRAELLADRPEVIEEKVNQILKSNPNLTDAHFLAYLNCSRVHEFTGSVDHLHNSLKAESEPKSFLSRNDITDDLRQGFRYSALNMAALHARFGQERTARLALAEATMLAQVADDHICLQQILTWLYRLEPTNKKMMIEHCITKSRQYKLTHLTSLGFQSLAKVIAESGGSPTDVMSLLSQSEMLNCQNSLNDLINSGFSLKSAFWCMYGRSNLSCTISQLLLLLASTSNVPAPNVRIGEEIILALANVGRQLNDRGKLKECDAILNLARSLCPTDQQCLSTVDKVSTKINFERCLHQTDWNQAQGWITKASSDPKDTLEPVLMHRQLAICQGNSEAARSIANNIHSFTDRSAVQDVYIQIMESETFCLSKDYANAVMPLMTALKVCADHNLTFLNALVNMHIAHIQLQFRLPHRALALLRGSLPQIMSHGSLFEMSRVRLLLAKCLIASVSKDRSAGSRGTLFEAVAQLKMALAGFKTCKSYARAKDVVYLLAMVCHSMDLISERNQWSAEFKILDNDHPATNCPSQIANMF